MVHTMDTLSSFSSVCETDVCSATGFTVGGEPNQFLRAQGHEDVHHPSTGHAAALIPGHTQSEKVRWQYRTGDGTELPVEPGRLSMIGRRSSDRQPQYGGSAPNLTPASDCMIVELDNNSFFLAAAPSMRSIHAKICTIAKSDVPVLITGESGVGKEVVANLLHRQSARAGRQFLKINCAALPNDLLESELFGYEAGAFTGAMKAKPGKFEMCGKGTLLLDEIGEMSPQLQAKLLHVLQDGEFSRLGARVNTRVDVRVVAATNVNIEQAIQERKFREDLYYRLNTFVLHIPPLRERREEIPFLLEELSLRFARSNHLEPIGFSPRLLAAALEFSWPGNLRELGNFVRRYLILRDEAGAMAELETKLHSEAAKKTSVVRTLPTENSADSDLKSAVRSLRDQTEIQMISEVLDGANWNRRVAAERLQISYRALLYKIRQHKLNA